MVRLPDGVGDTVLTERQSEVLVLRREGLTQREVADRLGTSVANVSAIEKAARENVAAARRTVALAAVLDAAVRFTATAGTDLRDLVDAVYERGDAAGVKVAYVEPGLASYLHDRLGDRLEDRRLTADVEVGITAEGEVVTYPADSSP